MVEMILSVMYDSGERKFVENYASAGQVEVVKNYDRDKKEYPYISILMFPIGGHQAYILENCDSGNKMEIVNCEDGSDMASEIHFDLEVRFAILS